MSASYPRSDDERLADPAAGRVCGRGCSAGSAPCGDSLPVAATIWLNVVWTRLSASANGISPATVWPQPRGIAEPEQRLENGCAVVA